jgi:hypothetical protein
MLRKALVLACALLALFATAAQAHTATATVTCGSVTGTWLDFATTGNGNGGLNSPTYSITFTPVGASSPTKVYTGQVLPGFAGGDFSLPPFEIPKENGTVVASSSWTAAQTRDNTAGSVTATFQVTTCPAQPAISTVATPASATVGAQITDVAQLTGGNNPTGTLTWTLYGPNDPTCAAAGAPTVTAQVSGNRSYTSPPISPTQSGTYHWVASYGGDANNNPVGGACNDANETVTLTGPTPPAISTVATPAGATVGAQLTDVAQLTGANNPTGTLTWTLYGPNDPTCAAVGAPTVTAPVTGDGSYTSPPITPAAAGTYHWVASYGGDANNSAVRGSCNDANETVTLTSPPAPGFTLTKLQAIDNSGQAFTTQPIIANVGQKIDYQVVVTNTGNTPLNLSLIDTMCTAIAGPTGNLTGSTLAVGGTATWTCSHVVVAADFPTYVNVAEVTGTPPGGSPLPPERASVLANVPRSGEEPVCIASAPKIQKTTSNGGRTVNVIVSGAKKVVFSLDGHAVKTLTKANLSGGRFEWSVKLSSTRYGTHSVTTKATDACGKARSDGLTFTRNVPPKPVVPRFTG